MVQPEFREPASFTDPPYEPDCEMCDGDRKVEVAMYRDADGAIHAWPLGRDDVPAPEVDCPWCAR